MSRGLRGVKRRPELPFGFTISRLNASQQVDGKRYRLRCGTKVVDVYRFEVEAIDAAIAMAPSVYGPEPVDRSEEVDAETLAILRSHRAQAQGVVSR